MADVLAVEGMELWSANTVIEKNNRELAAGHD
jgi:hypothetical protein